MLRNCTRLLLLLVFMLAGAMTTYAQDDNTQEENTSDENAPQNLVHTCIDPLIGDSYLITFRDADMTNHTVGFAVPENAIVTVYSHESVTTAVGVYSIVTDALTGGYRRSGVMAKAYARNDIPVGEKSCATEYPTIITGNLISTIPLPVSLNQAVIIQTGADTLLDTAEFTGVFTLHFRPDSGSFQEDIQIIQLSEGGIEVSFPFVTEDTRIVLIANKEVRLRKSFSQVPGDFLAQSLTNPTAGFSQSLARELLNAGSEERLSLYQLMETSGVRIYPAFGLVDIYPTGGFLRLEMSPVAATRETFLEEGVKQIRAIEGLEADYFVVNNPTERYNVLNNPPDATTAPKTLEVVRVDTETGQLIVKTPAGDGYIEAWYVEVVPPQ